MTEEGYFDIWLNPLQIYKLDHPRSGSEDEAITIEDFLAFFCVPGVSYGLEDFISRYKDINKESPRWSLAPNESNILEKIVWPLRQAKANFVLGNHLATIALSGIVAEMLSILLFEISTLTMNGKPITQRDQEKLYGRKFEKLSQARRVEVLRAYGIVDDELAADFSKVAESRNRYLHNWSVDHKNLEDEARQAYLATVTIAVRVTGQEVHEGRVYMTPALISYLQERGVYRPKD